MRGTGGDDDRLRGGEPVDSLTHAGDADRAARGAGECEAGNHLRGSLPMFRKSTGGNQVNNGAYPPGCTQADHDAWFGQDGETRTAEEQDEDEKAEAAYQDQLAEAAYHDMPA